MPPKSSKSRRRVQSNRSHRPPPPPPRKMTVDEVQALRDAMKQQLNGREPRDFQVDLVQAQEERKDALCQAATGQGKTAIAAGPYALAQNSERVTFMVSPLIGLQDEMVETFREDFNLSAVAVNSAHGGCSPQLMAEIVAGKYRIVLLSPEMLLSRRFIDNVLRQPALAARIYSVVIDEAHCISHWGVDFRKKYSQIGMIRVFLPRNTPFIAVSASLTRRVAQDVIDKLQMARGSYVYRNMGNDRSNVSIVVRAIHNTMQSFSDLDFVIPSNVTSAADIPKTWIYADNIATGAEIIDHLRTLLPEHLHGTIRPYNAVHGADYRKQAMAGFRSGDLRILVCTDAAGMGCNIPDIEIVVQWKLPNKLSSFIQRAGRAARAPNIKGLAVLLVEPSAYSVELLKKDLQVSQPKGKRGPKSTRPAEGKGKKMEFAKARGRNRGGLTADDAITVVEQPSFDEFDEGEGLTLFVQYTKCRRELLREVFNSPDSANKLTVPCCDICCPTLLDRTRPGMKVQNRGGKRLAYGEKIDTVEKALIQWRKDVLERKNATYLTADCILPNDAVRKLSTLKQPLSTASIEGYLSHQWYHWSDYGEELTELLVGLQPEVAAPPLPPPSSSPSPPTRPDDAVCRTAAKHPREDDLANDAVLAALPDPSAKRQRTNINERPLALTPVQQNHVLDTTLSLTGNQAVREARTMSQVQQYNWTVYTPAHWEAAGAGSITSNPASTPHLSTRLPHPMPASTPTDEPSLSQIPHTPVQAHSTIYAPSPRWAVPQVPLSLAHAHPPPNLRCPGAPTPSATPLTSQRQLAAATPLHNRSRQPVRTTAPSAVPYASQGQAPYADNARLSVHPRLASSSRSHSPPPLPTPSSTPHTSSTSTVYSRPTMAPGSFEAPPAYGPLCPPPVLSQPFAPSHVHASKLAYSYFSPSPFAVASSYALSAAFPRQAQFLPTPSPTPQQVPTAQAGISGIPFAYNSMHPSSFGPTHQQSSLAMSMAPPHNHSDTFPPSNIHGQIQVDLDLANPQVQSSAISLPSRQVVSNMPYPPESQRSAQHPYHYALYQQSNFSPH
ncbi:hypothetical protein EVG20_g9099 [Dentipellis fragilis]|uniref:DNA 3'-5' helicase n=1 Tax=Dentipellis fragilis TaxID=205917 RepID=A0A4Y9Y3M1_9AGAM|nr:hypothetical protein EVG20_g9099 [Dentipellis fragilis]